MSAGSPQVLSSLKFHGYLAISIHMSGDECRNASPGDERRGVTPFYALANMKLASLCSAWRSRFAHHMQSYEVVSGKVQGFPKHLLTPVCFVGLGQADNIGLVLADDFEIAAKLLEEPDLPVKETGVSFCPSLDTLGLAHDPAFVELRDLVSALPVTAHDDVPRPVLLRASPLCGITRFRVSGLCNLGSGLLWHEALLRAMARRISGIVQSWDGSKVGGSPDDAQAFRCAFMLPVGWSDLCTVMLGNNYSLIMTVVHQLRQIRIGDLVAVMKTAYGRDVLGNMINEFGIHRRLAEHGHADHHSDSDDAGFQLGANHAFCSSSTALGVEHHSFLSPRAEVLRGYVCPTPHFAVPLGHEEEVRRECSPSEALVGVHLPGARWINAGEFDCTDVAVFRSEELRACTVPQLIKRLKELRDPVMPNSHPGHLWPVLHISVDMLVPCPSDTCERGGGVVDPCHVNLRPVLRDLCSDALGENGVLSLAKLSEAMHALRMPVALASTFRTLFSDFGKCLRDPLMFDNVLDLLEFFAAVHRLIVGEMQESLCRDVEGCDVELAEVRRLAFIDAHCVEELSALIEVMEDAMRRRTHVAFRDIRRSPMGADLRNGMNRIVHAADVPLRCGMSILRRVLLGEVEGIPTELDVDLLRRDPHAYWRFRTQMSGASKLSYSSRVIAHRFALGDRRTNFLATTSLNAVHLTRPAFLLSQFHEVGHLLRDLLGTARHGALPYGARECDHCSNQVALCQQGNERLEEIFAEMFVYALLFHQSDSVRVSQRVYGRQYFAMYFLDPISMCFDSRLTLRRFAEVATRAFLAVDTYASSVPLQDGRTSGDDSSEAMESRFWAFLDETAPMFCEYGRFGGRQEVRAYIRTCLHAIAKSSMPYLQKMASTVAAIVRSICGEGEPGGCGTGPLAADDGPLVEQFRAGLRNGIPIVRQLYRNGRWEGISEDEREKHVHLDALYVCREVLRLLICEEFEGLDVSAETCYLREQRACRSKANSHRLDRIWSGCISEDLAWREAYLRQRICTLATFWDLSTVISGRALRRLIDEVWPRKVSHGV